MTYEVATFRSNGAPMRVVRHRTVDGEIHPDGGGIYDTEDAARSAADELNREKECST